MVTDICKDFIFVSDRDPSWKQPLISTLGDIQPILHQLGNTLLHNLESVHQVAGIPLSMAISGAKDQRLALLHVSEKIRAEYLLDGLSENEQSADATRQRACTALENELMTPDGSGGLARIAIDKVESLIQDDNFLKTAQELLRQSTVLTWGALEVLSEDLFATLLNNRTNLITRLREDEGAKKLFGFKNITFGTLESYGYDLSKNLGNVLLEIHSVDTIPIMRTVFAALFNGESTVLSALGNNRLYELNQRRHLIVHRLGIIDDEYIIRTNADLEVGSPLIIKTSDIARYIDCVRDAGIALLQAASSALEDKEA